MSLEFQSSGTTVAAYVRAMAYTVDTFWPSFAMHPKLLHQPIAHADLPDRGEDTPLRQLDDAVRSEAPSRTEETRTGRMISHGLQRKSVMNDQAKVEVVMTFESAQTDSSGWQAWSTAIPARLWSQMRRWHRNRKAMAELAALDDLMLKDIGISRHEIEHVVRYGSGRR